MRNKIILVCVCIILFGYLSNFVSRGIVAEAEIVTEINNFEIVRDGRIEVRNQIYSEVNIWIPFVIIFKHSARYNPKYQYVREWTGIILFGGPGIVLYYKEEQDV